MDSFEVICTAWINIEEPDCIEQLPEPLHRIEEMRATWRPTFETDLMSDTLQKALAVYTTMVKLAIYRVPDINRLLPSEH